MAVVRSHALPTSVIDNGSASRASISFLPAQPTPPPLLLPPRPSAVESPYWNQVFLVGLNEMLCVATVHSPPEECTVSTARKRFCVFRMSHGAPARRAIIVVITLQRTSHPLRRGQDISLGCVCVGKTGERELHGGRHAQSCLVPSSVCKTPDLAMCIYVCVWTKLQECHPISFGEEGGGEEGGGVVHLLPGLFLCLQTSSRGRASGDTPCPRTRCALLLGVLPAPVD